MKKSYAPNEQRCVLHRDMSIPARGSTFMGGANLTLASRVKSCDSIKKIGPKCERVKSQLVFRIFAVNGRSFNTRSPPQELSKATCHPISCFSLHNFPKVSQDTPEFQLGCSSCARKELANAQSRIFTSSYENFCKAHERPWLWEPKTIGWQEGICVLRTGVCNEA